jgi:hypothetical protein
MYDHLSRLLLGKDSATAERILVVKLEKAARTQEIRTTLSGNCSAHRQNARILRIRAEKCDFG